MVNLIFLCLAICASAFFSGMETALISASHIQLKIWARHGKKSAKHALVLLQKPERFLTTTLVGTNVSVVSASFLMAFYLARHFSAFTITVISSIILLIFAHTSIASSSAQPGLGLR